MTGLKSSIHNAQIPCMPSVAAYDALAPLYSTLMERRKQYLKAVESIIVAHAQGARSLLDVGAGTGVRSLKIANACGIEHMVLIEPSNGMRSEAPASTAIWKHTITETSGTTKYDLITLLWNVLGHLSGLHERVFLLSKLRGLLNPSGVLFLDVNHRYNAISYGWTKTACRILGDHLFPSEDKGDVLTSWQVGDKRICTRGHVFTHRELVELFRRADLKLRARWIIDYRNGAQHRFSLFGNLLYQLTVE